MMRDFDHCLEVFGGPFDKDASGGLVLNLSLTQSNVDDGFRMLVPLYVELSDGRVAYFGHAPLAGNTTLQQKVPLKGLKTPPKRVLVNYMYDVLAN
jgi:hypothetical protein